MTIDNDKISGIYQDGRKQEPPAHLDSAILSAAREAVEHDAGRHEAGKQTSVEVKHARGPFSGNWPALTSIAAVLVITVILVPLLTQEESHTPAPDLTDDGQASEMEQDMLYRFNAEQAEIQNNEKSKKRMLLKAREPKLSIMKESGLLLDSHEMSGRSEAGALEEGAFEEGVAEQENVPVRTLPAASAYRKSGAEPSVSTFQSLESTLNTDIKLQDSPQKWLEKIRRLVEQGDITTAQDELEKFRRLYPEHEIDQSILKQISSRPR